jgi:uncharacterized protein YwqG
MKQTLNRLIKQPRVKDWEKEFDKTFLNVRFDTTIGTSVNLKDYISNLLKQQEDEYKQKMAQSNEWWNTKLRQQKKEITDKIINNIEEYKHIIKVSGFNVNKDYSSGWKNCIEFIISLKSKHLTNSKQGGRVR